MTEIALHFAANLLSCWIIVRLIYQSKAKRRDFVFTFTMVSASVFLLCRMLSGVELDLAFALGLFAIFGIIRYRTNPVPIREMTYLFLVIAMALLAAVGTMQHLELVLLNGLIIALALVLETRVLLPRHGEKEVEYEKIENVHHEKQGALIEDLRQRTGLDVFRVDVVSISYLRDTAMVRMHFRQEGHHDR